MRARQITLATHTTPPYVFTLEERTQRAELGKVTAFVSHSWHDEKEPNMSGEKYKAIKTWADDNGKETTLWLVRSPRPPSPQARKCLPLRAVHAPSPQDKACIPQDNIDQSLRCLPVFLAGCQRLLCVVGPTYCSRLWCVMEARYARPMSHDTCYT